MKLEGAGLGPNGPAIIKITLFAASLKAAIEKNYVFTVDDKQASHAEQELRPAQAEDQQAEEAGADHQLEGQVNIIKHLKTNLTANSHFLLHKIN